MRKQPYHCDESTGERESHPLGAWWLADFRPGYEYRNCHACIDWTCDCRKPCCYQTQKIRSKRRENLYYWDLAVNHARHTVFDLQGPANSFYAAWEDCIGGRLHDRTRGPMFKWQCDGCNYWWQQVKFRYLLRCPHCKSGESIVYKGKGDRVPDKTLATYNKETTEYRASHNKKYAELFGVAQK